MFGVSRERLVAGLHALNAGHCEYTRAGAADAASRCDCKYGVTSGSRGSEQNGCPELRMAEKLLSALTPLEFARACKRAGVVVFVHDGEAIAIPSAKAPVKRKAKL